MTRDQRVNEELKSQGWTVLRYWESDIKSNLDEILKDIKNHLN